MLTPSALTDPLLEGFRAIRAANGVEEGSERLQELACIAASVTLQEDPSRRDATDLPFVTLDPASSTDLDQAFAVRREGDDIVLFYAIADIGAFVARGSALEAQAWRQGVTVYCPDKSVPLYPRELSGQRASLLPDGPRPAILHTLLVDALGVPRLRKVERAWVRSRAKLAYDSVSAAQLSADVIELSTRIKAAEARRGAFRVERQEQEVVSDPGSQAGWTLRYVQRHASEDHNAALSLATNLAVASYFLEHACGLYRVMDEPNPIELTSLRNQAALLGVPWEAGERLQQVVSRLDQSRPDHAAFALAMRRTGGGASYAVLCAPEGAKGPWHAAIAAPYAHATAPMRRLADRYVLDLLVALFQRDAAAVDELQAVLAKLPEVMETAERRSGRIDRECIELVEARILETRVGEILTGQVMEVLKDAVQLQVEHPAITWRVRTGSGSAPVLGAQVQVKVVRLPTPDKGRRTLPLTVTLQLL
jgi:VacB/RNase II family 3'-5' exoribonuclease